MHPRTKRLRELMDAHKLTSGQVARLLDRSPLTVRVWRVMASDTRVIPADALQVLELTMAARK